MIYLRIAGSCGNQFFQYAFARSIQGKMGGDLVIDYNLVQENKILWEGSDNLLQHFNVVPYRYTTVQEHWKYKFLNFIFKFNQRFQIDPFSEKRYKRECRWAHFLEIFGVYYFDAPYFDFKYPKRKNVVIQGYFESPKYFAEIDDKLKAELTSKESLNDVQQALQDKLKSTNSVCITIRTWKREDEDTTNRYSVCDRAYYEKAVSYICEKVENPVFYVCSDDVEWCRNNIAFPENVEVIFEGSENELWDKLTLMRSCAHYIISNSTFSWWAQHLGGHDNSKMVVAPREWMKDWNHQPIDIYEEGWTYLD